MAQPLLHQCEHFGVIGRLGIEHPLGREPRLGDAGREQVAPADDPQHRSPGARGDPGKEQGGSGIVAYAWARARHLVQRIESQPRRRQLGIDRPDPERQHGAAAQAIAFDRTQRFAQGNKGIGRGQGTTRFGLCSHFVPISGTESSDRRYGYPITVERGAGEQDDELRTRPLAKALEIL